MLSVVREQWKRIASQLVHMRLLWGVRAAV